MVLGGSRMTAKWMLGVKLSFVRVDKVFQIVVASTHWIIFLTITQWLNTHCWEKDSEWFYLPPDLYECCLAWLGHSNVPLPGNSALVFKLPHRQVNISELLCGQLFSHWLPYISYVSVVYTCILPVTCSIHPKIKGLWRYSLDVGVVYWPSLT